MTELRQAIRPFVGRVAGNTVMVHAGDLYDAEDALVRAFTDKFGEVKVRSTAGLRDRTQKKPAPRRAPRKRA